MNPHTMHAHRLYTASQPRDSQQTSIKAKANHMCHTAQPPLGYLICLRCCCDCLAASAASCPTGFTTCRDAAWPEPALASPLPAVSARTTPSAGIWEPAPPEASAALMACAFCTGRPWGTTVAAAVRFTAAPAACSLLVMLTMWQAPTCLILTLRQAAMQLLLYVASSSPHTPAPVPAPQPVMQDAMAFAAAMSALEAATA
jgi:hypothetical protein